MSQSNEDPSHQRLREALQQIRSLETRLTKFVSFAKAHEQWEADMLNDSGPWFDQLITDDFQKVQSLRNEAMVR